MLDYSRMFCTPGSVGMIFIDDILVLEIRTT